MKSYTDLEQSKKLTEILSLGSADMYYMETSPNDYTIGILQRLERDMLLNQAEYYKMFPCWSLVALLEVLPPGKVLLHDKGGLGYKCICNNLDTDFYDNPVDACFEMIVELNELELLQL